MTAPIGIFDSGYGGLTVLRDIVDVLPEYDFLYLGDNARAPYGTRDFQTIYHYTLSCVQYLFAQGCPLVILACNTASARALRTIQQRDLPRINPENRVLGIIRPTAEVIGDYTATRKVGVLGTPGTVRSESYVIEIQKHFPDITVVQQACPLWVPLVENGLIDDSGTAHFVERDLQQLLEQNFAIDTVLLGCTHYPLLEEVIAGHLPKGITLLSQGKIVAHALADYLRRHPEMKARLSRLGQRTFLTTGDEEEFDKQGSIFFGSTVSSRRIVVD